MAIIVAMRCLENISCELFTVLRSGEKKAPLNQTTGRPLITIWVLKKSYGDCNMQHVIKTTNKTIDLVGLYLKPFWRKNLNAEFVLRVGRDKCNGWKQKQLHLIYNCSAPTSCPLTDIYGLFKVYFKVIFINSGFFLALLSIQLGYEDWPSKKL